MPLSLRFFNDTGLTDEITSLAVTQPNSGAGPHVDREIHLGSNASAKIFFTEINPNVDSVVVSVVDPAPGSGVETSHIRLANSQAALDTATPGAPVDTQTVNFQSGGNGNEVVFWARIQTPALPNGVYSGVSLQTNSLLEQDDV